MNSAPEVSVEKGHILEEQRTEQKGHDINTASDELNSKSFVLPTAASSSLPPVDRGYRAWLFLAACYVNEALVFGAQSSGYFVNSYLICSVGFGFSFGVFQDYYSTHAPFAGSGGIAVIGTLTTASTLNLTTPLV